MYHCQPLEIILFYFFVVVVVVVGIEFYLLSECYSHKFMTFRVDFFRLCFMSVVYFYKIF